MRTTSIVAATAGRKLACMAAVDVVARIAYDFVKEKRGRAKFEAR